MKILWLHGKESGPFGSKYHALIDAGFDVVAPDLQDLSLEARVAKVIPELQSRPFVVGSSMGGITAVLAARAYGGPLPGLLLCAPAFRLSIEPLSALGLKSPVTIIHGRRDDLVPIEDAREYARQHGATLVEVDDGHRLAESLERIVAEATRMTAASV